MFNIREYVRALMAPFPHPLNLARGNSHVPLNELSIVF